MTEVERAVLVATILTAWQAQDGGEAPDLIELSVSSTLAVDTSEVARLQEVTAGDGKRIADMQAEVAHMRQVIAEYVAEVESGERFAALVGMVPGLELTGSAVDLTQRPCKCWCGDWFTVCDACLQHACWAGLYMCEDAHSAGALDKRTLPVEAA